MLQHLIILSFFFHHVSVFISFFGCCFFPHSCNTITDCNHCKKKKNFLFGKDEADGNGKRFTTILTIFFYYQIGGITCDAKHESHPKSQPIKRELFDDFGFCLLDKQQSDKPKPKD